LNLASLDNFQLEIGQGSWAVSANKHGSVVFEMPSKLIADCILGTPHPLLQSAILPRQPDGSLRRSIPIMLLLLRAIEVPT
jgi:hypothetical protein